MSYFAILKHLDVVAISGEDAAEFISNQFTSDTNQINEREIHQSAWCDPKGRVLFAPLLFKHDNGYRCLIPKDLSAQFCQRLKMFVLRSQVSIEPLDDLAVAGVEFEQNVPVLEDRGREEAPLQFLAFPSGNIVASNVSRYYVIGDANAIDAFTTAQALSRKDRQWHRDQLLNGIAEINAALSGEYLPQQLNFDALNAVSFQKGCYPGQEIIARLKYRGKVKKRLCPLVCDSPDTDPGEFAPMEKSAFAGRPRRAAGAGALWP